MLDDYLPYQKDLYRYISKLLSSPAYAQEDVEEVLQETYCRVLKRSEGSDAHPNPKAYLFLVAKNIVIDQGRRKKVRREDDHVPIEDDCLSADGKSAEDQAAMEQLKNRMSEGLECLNAKDREVFVMHQYMSLTQSEIAKILHVSVRTVERRMSSAVDHFRKKLREFI